MNDYIFGCPKCSKEFRVLPEFAGEVVQCPHCAQKMRIPEEVFAKESSSASAPASSQPERQVTEKPQIVPRSAQTKLPPSPIPSKPADSANAVAVPPMRQKGDKSKGEKSKGDESKGAESKGDESKGDESKGDKSKGDKSSFTSAAGPAPKRTTQPGGERDESRPELRPAKKTAPEKTAPEKAAKGRPAKGRPATDPSAIKGSPLAKKNQSVGADSRGSRQGRSPSDPESAGPTGLPTSASAASPDLPPSPKNDAFPSAARPVSEDRSGDFVPRFELPQLLLNLSTPAVAAKSDSQDSPAQPITSGTSAVETGAAQNSPSASGTGFEGEGIKMEEGVNVEALLPPQFLADDPTRPWQQSEGSNRILLPTADGGLQAVHERLVTIEYKGQKYTVLAATPEERRRRQLISNLLSILVAIGAIAGTIWILLK